MMCPTNWCWTCPGSSGADGRRRRRTEGPGAARPNRARARRAHPLQLRAARRHCGRRAAHRRGAPVQHPRARAVPAALGGGARLRRANRGLRPRQLLAWSHRRREFGAAAQEFYSRERGAAVMKTRIEQLRALFAGAGIDGLLVTGATNRRYMTGFTGSAGMALITRDEALLLTDFRYIEQAAQQAPDYEVVRYDDPYAILNERLQRYKGQRIGFESHHVTVHELENIKKAGGDAPPVEWVPVKGLV